MPAYINGGFRIYFDVISCDVVFLLLCSIESCQLYHKTRFEIKLIACHRGLDKTGLGPFGPEWPTSAPRGVGERDPGGDGNGAGGGMGAGPFRATYDGCDVPADRKTGCGKPRRGETGPQLNPQESKSGRCRKIQNCWKKIDNFFFCNFVTLP